MTKEEAIRKLQKQKAEYLEEWVDFSGIAEAYDMAIEALKVQSTDDLISRQDAIEAVASADETDGTAKVFTGRQINGILSALPSTEAAQRWISCNKKLPEDNKEVLICLEWGIDIGTYDRGEWRSEWINHYDDDNVLAWMPLPKPYKGGDSK